MEGSSSGACPTSRARGGSTRQGTASSRPSSSRFAGQGDAPATPIILTDSNSPSPVAQAEDDEVVFVSGPTLAANSASEGPDVKPTVAGP